MKEKICWLVILMPPHGTALRGEKKFNLANGAQLVNISIFCFTAAGQKHCVSKDNKAGRPGRRLCAAPESNFIFIIATVIMGILCASCHHENLPFCGFGESHMASFSVAARGRGSAIGKLGTAAAGDRV
jgi:hypothetical protein